MKRVNARLACLLLAAALAPVTAGGMARGVPPAPSCAGETWHVSYRYHDSFFGRVSPAGNANPAAGVGSATSVSTDVEGQGTYVLKRENGKFRWAQRTISWHGQLSDDVPACRKVACDGGTEVELGPLAGDGPNVVGTDEAKEHLKWRCSMQRTGNCFGYFPHHGPIPKLDIVNRSKLIQGHYREVLPDGARYSVWMEPSGTARVTVSADPSDIPPNKGPSLAGGNDDPTSWITVTATCDGKPLDFERVGLRIDVEPRSGDHNHIDGRPRGKLDGVSCGLETGEAEGDMPCIVVKTDEKGEARVKFASPLTGSKAYARYGAYEVGIAGNYKVSAKLMGYAGRAETAVLAQVKGLTDLTPSIGLEQGRGDTSSSSKHPRGSSGTPRTLAAFASLGKDFRRYQEIHNAALVSCGKDKDQWKIEPLQVNDIALPGGGVFDWQGTWRPSHQTHNKGEGGDFNRFGAGGDDSGIDWNKTGAECDGSVVPIQYTFMHIVMDLGWSYGRWDCGDLRGVGVGRLSTMEECVHGETWMDRGYLYYPARLHLHVDD